MRLPCLALAACLSLVTETSAHAQGGQQPVRIVMPYPAGGVGDTTARLVAEALRAGLNRPVIVENKPGAAGRIGVQAVKDAPNDGSVLLFTPIAPMAIFPNVYEKLAYDPAGDFEPISQIATFDLGVAVGANVPAKSLKELVGWLQANPEKATYGTPAAGSLPHFFAVLFGRSTSIELRHVAYKGNTQAISDLIGGHLPIFFTSTQDLVEPHKAGLIRVMATSGTGRSISLPDVPTFAESGYAIHGEGWYGMYAPARTSEAVVARLSEMVNAAIGGPELNGRLKALGLKPTGTSPAEFARIQKFDMELWRPVIKASGFKPD